MFYCHNCHKRFKPLGIMRHRAMHRDKKEDVFITLSNGNKRFYEFSKQG